MINKFFPINFPWQVIIARVYGWASFPWRQRSRSSLNAGTGIDFMTCLGARTILVHNNFIWFLRKFQSQSCIKVICFPPTRKQQSLGLTLSKWWQVLWILRSFKKLKKIIYTVHSNTIMTIYPWFRSKTKPKLTNFSHSTKLVTKVRGFISDLDQYFCFHSKAICHDLRGYQAAKAYLLILDSESEIKEKRDIMKICCFSIVSLLFLL